MVMQGRKKYTLKLGSVEAEVHEQAVCIGDYMGTSVGYGAPESCFDLCLSVDGKFAAYIKKEPQILRSYVNQGASQHREL